MHPIFPKANISHSPQNFKVSLIEIIFNFIIPYILLFIGFNRFIIKLDLFTYLLMFLKILDS